MGDFDILVMADTDSSCSTSTSSCDTLRSSSGNRKAKKGRCNWCSDVCRLVSGKPYCKVCEKNAFRVCIRCHRPFPNSNSFAEDPVRCNACHKKLVHERELRKTKKSATTGTTTAAAATDRDKVMQNLEESAKLMGFGQRKVGYIPVFF